MRTVLYFEFRRKRKQMLKYIVLPLVISLLLFAVCMVIDTVFPAFNRNYMKWPDLVKDFICLKPWSGDLWLNVWQLFALVYPFYLIYVMMSETAEAITEEERLETVVYLHNAGIDRKTIFVGKLLIWTGEIIACCVSLLLLNVVCAALLGQTQGMKNALAYYASLFLVSMFYQSIALFVAACRGKKNSASDVLTPILILPWLISRIPALFRFFAALLMLTGREGVIVERIETIGHRSEVLTIVSPLTWSWPALKIQESYVVCGIVLFVVLLIAALSIYTHKRNGSA